MIVFKIFLLTFVIIISGSNGDESNDTNFVATSEWQEIKEGNFQEVRDPRWIIICMKNIILQVKGFRKVFTTE